VLDLGEPEGGCFSTKVMALLSKFEGGGGY